MIRGGMIRGRGGVMISRGGIRRPMTTGPRPSFQYRDGSFICDLCKKSFSDGNDMVTHWKSHVKQQRANMVSGPSRGGSMIRGRGRPSGRGLPPPSRGQRGRPGRPGPPGRRGPPPKGKAAKGKSGKKDKTGKAERSDKGRPRWTAYLLWSTRRRKEITGENESFTFAQIGRMISDEWKKVEGEALDKLKEEAEKLNFDGVRKLPGFEGSSKSRSRRDRSSGSDASESWSEDDDPTFDETNVKKPVMLKIKREQEERNTRQRKRPSFFQDYENEENNLDKMLDEFEQEQILEARTPREPRVKREPKNPGSRPRKRKVEENRDQDEDKEIELETSRSGRVRKIRRRKVYAFDDPDEEEDDSGDNDDEFRPDSEPEEPDEEYLDGPSPPASDEDEESDNKLPLKKRLPGDPMTKAEIEAAKRAAFAAKPQIVVDGNKYKGKDKRDEIDRIIKPGEEDNLDFSDDELSQVLKMQPKIKKEPEEEKPTTSEMETNAAESSGDSKVPEDVSLNTPKSNPEDMDEDGDEKEESEQAQPKKSTESAAASNADDEATKEEGGDLEGSVTEETQNWDSDNDVVDDEPLEDDDNAQKPTSSAAASNTVNFGTSDNGDMEANATTQDTLSANNVAPFSDESRTAANNVVENGQNSLDSEHPQRPPNDPQKETSAEEDLLSSTQATDMEEGDEQYKNMIAESQMDNLFN